jgi:hypothetical protein
LSTAYYHLVLPHDRLRQRLEVPEPTRGRNGTLKKWKPVTPAMAAQMTAHGWTTHELLSYRVPAHFWSNCQSSIPSSPCWKKSIKSNEGHYPRKR